MKFKVIQGEKGKKQDTQNQVQDQKQNNSQKPGSPSMPNMMEDYYAKERPRSQDMEQAEGDEDIVDDALKNQEKTGDAA
jgi:hypothetical protein